MNRIVEPDTACQHATAFTLRDEDRQRCEIWTRVMGYHRPVASFNLGKKSEFAERRYFVEEPFQRD
ncbi:anaerobic ribonucleoside-triphosphate reductase [Aliirhizobium smilacinae]|uniref:Oxidoreductase n=1 Tax=Aliirhizobium smilacinae TaxID=1395944 RepID=A0A5C4XCI0_9HYPH|nr:anaerobic ribonucleoside-triphosphate reductase [Rhizobium smilacinae]TNM61193.1 hypothetical protein FHP24_21825 [Rhizobium smilacinae]